MSSDLHEKKEQPSSPTEDTVPQLAKDAPLVAQDDGVTRIEALYLVFSKGWKLWMLYGCVHRNLEHSVRLSSEYDLYVRDIRGLFFRKPSINRHHWGGYAHYRRRRETLHCQGISSMADLAGRPWAITFSVALYCLGFIIIASSKTISAVAAGEVINTVGNTGINLLTGILISDITSLQWRGLMHGIFSLPFIMTAFIAGDISTAISANTANGWRWGYGMFIILVPVCLCPALFILFWGDRKAKKLGTISLAASSYSRRQQLAGEKEEGLLKMAIYYLRIMDAFGLILLGFAFTLILLPFTLYTTAKDGWKNPSIIAMFVVGGLLLIAFFIYEWKYTEHPIMPRRVMNRTLICCIVIDFMYYLSGYLGTTYFSSWIYVIKDWSLKEYTYYNQVHSHRRALWLLHYRWAGTTLYTSLQSHPAVAFLLHFSSSYSCLLRCGLSIRIIGQGLLFLAANGNPSDAVLIMAQILVSLGGSFSVISTQVASQASVPHQDMATAISLVSLWTSVGGGIGSAISAAIWNDKLPRYLNEELGSFLNSTQIEDIYGSILVAREAQPRDLVIKAYTRTMWYLLLPALSLSFISLIAGCMTTDFYLGDTQNAIETDKVIKLRTEEELEQMREKAEQKEKTLAV
ncbi:hypothetical protein MKEN_00338900 [Mycena kentingensis (nom. inval.)]|nr:hypothetical protein MKEN_00338900 [Mycena kentingensis (nom. inval.)]